MATRSITDNIEHGLLLKLGAALKKTGFSARRHVIDIHATCVVGHALQ